MLNSSQVFPDFAVKFLHAGIINNLVLNIIIKFNDIFCRYEVKFQQAMECGGAYVKLLSHQDSLDLVRF